ncbi:hypothetical protein [Sporosarcina sp. SG10008]|uniref:hypothetical protein n=1 Tax=Sporosarcina sp. SG10008 TaxID=3373103 RepID=UPI0037DDC078
MDCDDAIRARRRVAELHRWQNEDHYEERPQLDDFDLQAIQYEIEVAQKKGMHSTRKVLG